MATATLLLCACAHTPAAPPPPPEPCKPEPLRISLRASPRLNPGERGEALATVVRVYQLKGIGKLTSATFDDLLDHDKDALGDDLLGMQEVTINPGEKLEPPAARNADATYVVAVALFRQPSGTTWRVVKRLPAPDAQYCHPPAKTATTTTATTAATAPGADGSARFYLDENRVELR